MNPLDRDEEGTLEVAEYALGVLDAAGRAEIERRIGDEPLLVEELRKWQSYLSPLSEDVPIEAVRAVVWERIQAELGFSAHSAPARRSAPRPWGWHSIAFLRWTSAGATAVSVALACALVLHLPRNTPSETPRAAYQVATLASATVPKIANWTATVDLANGRIVTIPVVRPSVNPPQTAQLWLIPPGGKPASIGLLATDHPSAVSIPVSLLKEAVENASLAVSIEPAGGSPTGQPTGPVIALGVIGRT